MNTTAAYQNIYLTNTGSGIVNFSNFTFTGANAADFSINANACSTALTPNNQCTISVQFTPSGTGLRTASLQIADDASNSPQTVALAGFGQASVEALYTSTPNLDFGSLNINNGTTTNYISLYDEGTSNITISGIQITGANASEFTFYRNNCGTILSNSCSITIQFAPTALGLRTANLVISSDAPGSPLTIPLTGLGQANTEAISLNSVNVDFGAQNLNTQNTSAITVTNQGDDPVQFSQPTITGTNAGDFVIASNTCATLGNTACTITVAFTPSATGERKATLNINDNAAGSPQTVTLYGSGEAISQLLSASATTLDFGLQPSGVASANLSVQINNTGNDAVDLSAIKISGANAADFQIETGSNSCLNAVAAGSYCYVYIQFTPSVTAAESATLTVTNDSSSGPILVTLIGVGQAVTRTLSLSATALDAGAQTVGSADNYARLNLTNTGDAPINLYPPSITGANAAVFAIPQNYSNCPASLAAGGTCLVYVQFTPATVGVAKATLNINSNATNSPIAVSLTGTGTAASGAVLNFQVYNFGTVTVGSSNYGDVAAYDVGTANATFSSEVITGANAGDFVLSSNGCGNGGISPGTYCLLGINFTPTAAGPRTANLVITDSTPGSPHTVVLNGTGQ